MERRMAKFRKAAGLTQIKAAAALNETPMRLSAWESGRTKPPAYALVKMASLYGCDVNELAAGREGKGES